MTKQVEKMGILKIFQNVQINLLLKVVVLMLKSLLLHASSGDKSFVLFHRLKNNCLTLFFQPAAFLFYIIAAAVL